MITPLALGNIEHKITANEVQNESYIIAELLDYLRWLADQDTSMPITAGHVWTLYYEGVMRGRLWSEVCEDIGLPVRTDW